MKWSADEQRTLNATTAGVRLLIARLEPQLKTSTCPSCGARRHTDFRLFQTLEKLRGILHQLVTVEKAAREDS
jgi:hypothetical protein